MVEPEQFLKEMLKHPLLLDGLYVQGKQLDDVVDDQFISAFNKHTAASVQQVLIDIREEE